jgi:thioesterase domain-containing protein
VEFLLDRAGAGAGLNLEAVYQRSSREAKLLYILEQKKLAHLLAPDMEPVDGERRLRVHRHHNQLLAQYRPPGMIRAKIAFIKPGEKLPFDVKMRDPIREWAPFSHQPIDVYEAPGNHFNMFSSEHSPVLASRLHDCIRDITRGRSAQHPQGTEPR